jgi:hypothetical protein
MLNGKYGSPSQSMKNNQQSIERINQTVGQSSIVSSNFQGANTIMGISNKEKR